MPSARSDDHAGDPQFVALLVDFARALRAAGVGLGSGEVLAYCAAMQPLDPTDLLDLYWAGRSTLLTRREQFPSYDAVFRAFFLGYQADADPRQRFTVASRAEAQSVLQVPESEPGTGEQEEREAELGLQASDVAALKGKAFAACTPQELTALRRIITRLALTPPRRRTRRYLAARRGGQADLRRTVHETLRQHGEPGRLYRRRRVLRQRPLIFLLDVSGSMSDYSRNLLQFAYSAGRAGGRAGRVEVFCFGTRLTRITRQLAHRRVDAALAQAADAVLDWEGGTRIGESLATFVRDHGRRGLCRGGIVVVCSDGLDRGDPSVLDEAMQRLTRLCYRVVWLNPHKGSSLDYQPSSLGMIVAAPYVDVLLSGHDLASLEEFAAVLPRLG